jgi:3-dehydro-L-gulonate 2-dehydrogenase
MMPEQNSLLVSYVELKTQLKRVLLKEGFEEEQAELLSKIFAENNLYGKESHGLNRFPSFIDSVRKGFVKKNVEPELISKFNAFEQWDGKLGAGPVNALRCTERAIEIARKFGIGCVALKNSNHWMCGGTYGRKAAEAGFILLSWTNAIPTIPPWGSNDPKLGNNPLVIAIPRETEEIILDFAMSQYSYGKLEILKQQNKFADYDAGFDAQGNITKNPSEVLDTKRALPIGLWKGAGLSLVLDLLASVLSNGNSSFQIGKQGSEYGVSQIFIAINLAMPAIKENSKEIIDEIIKDFHSSKREKENEILYPGEISYKKRNENLKNGISINEFQWKQLLEM